jgi:hypothetical protein
VTTARLHGEWDFGAPLPTSESADRGDVPAVPPSELRAGQLLRATVDRSGVHVVDPVRLRGTMDPLRAMGSAGGAELAPTTQARM